MPRARPRLGITDNDVHVNGHDPAAHRPLRAPLSVGGLSLPTLRGFFGKLPDGIARQLYLLGVRSNLEKLKLLVESEDG